MPALVNSVISVGSRAPNGFAFRSYQPVPGEPLKSWPNPAMFVDSARSAEAAMNSGFYSCSRSATELT